MSRLSLLAPLALLFLASCRQDMHDQPRYEPMEASSFFADGRSARPDVPGTIARGELPGNEHFESGRQGDALATELPVPLTRELLERGRERYDIFCAACHDRTGYGQGMIVRRGMKQPPSLHIERLQQAPIGHFFDVITVGIGQMYDYSDRIEPEDRWAIAAYIRALQLSQNATPSDVTADERAKLEAL